MTHAGLAKQLDILGGRRVGGNDLPLEFLRHVPPHVVAVPGHNAGPVVVTLPLGRPDFLFLPGGVHPLKREATGDRHEDGGQEPDRRQAVQRDGNPKGEHQVTEDAFITGAVERHRHAPAVDGTRDQSPAFGEVCPQMTINERSQLSFKRVLEPGSIDKGCLLHVAYDRAYRIQRIVAPVGLDAQIRSP